MKTIMTPIFAMTAALSAFLLFLVQPLIAKPILPLLGGSPSVWITCMVTFQLLLLLGYTYAFVSSCYLTMRLQSVLHIGLFAASLLLLPFSLHTAWFEPHAHPQLWLVTTLLQSVGGPYVLLSSNAPMLQRWAAHTSHPLSRNPFPLYAASNFGSLLGLLAFPALLEPLLTTTQQFGALTAGYLVLVLGFAGCAELARRHERKPIAGPVRRTALREAPILRWLAYSAIPASLLFGTTTFIITDIASVPMLWIIPLMLYISSFIFAFSERKFATRPLVWIYLFPGLAALFCAVCASLAGSLGITPLIAISLTLATLFAGSLLFHRQLYELRPEANDSGLFYVIVALGGAVGGCFNTFVAPQIFLTAAEYPLTLALSLLVVLLPDFLGTPEVPRQKRFPYTLAALLLLLLSIWVGFEISDLGLTANWHLVITGALFAAVLFAALMLSDWFYNSLQRVVLAILVIGLIGGYLTATNSGSWLYAERNFFGISRVRQDDEQARLVYSHGVTLHGIQSTQNQYRLSPTTYYGPLADIFDHLPASAADAPIGVIGLGVGTVACYAKPTQEMDFFEIDPAAVRIATDPSYFTFMRDCPGRRSIVVGDGRIMLTEAPKGKYGFLIIDAFTSDAIPMHLLTLEALKTYKDKLLPHGLIAFNVSNRYLNLLPVFRTLSETLAWNGRYRFNRADGDPLGVSSLWIVFGSDDADFQPLDPLRWKPLPQEAGERFRWTDDYTNLLSVLRFTTGWTSAL